jgi:hypothetical protein
MCFFVGSIVYFGFRIIGFVNDDFIIKQSGAWMSIIKLLSWENSSDHNSNCFGTKGLDGSITYIHGKYCLQLGDYRRLNSM